MSHNFKIIHFCQRCGHEHDRTHESMLEVGVKCDVCNGYIVTPSGRANIQIKYTANIYVIRGEVQTSWIVANNKADAINYFTDIEGERYVAHRKLNNDEINDSRFLFHDSNSDNPEGVWIGGRDIITMYEALPVLVFTMTNEEIEQLKNQSNKENGES